MHLLPGTFQALLDWPVVLERRKLGCSLGAVVRCLCWGDLGSPTGTFWWLQACGGSLLLSFNLLLQVHPVGSMPSKAGHPDPGDDGVGAGHAAPPEAG